MPASASALPFSVGFVVSTVMLHGLGIAAGLGLRNQPQAVRFAGATIALQDSACWRSGTIQIEGRDKKTFRMNGMNRMAC